jgi:hypothetical protein
MLSRTIFRNYTPSRIKSVLHYPLRTAWFKTTKSDDNWPIDLVTASKYLIFRPLLTGALYFTSSIFFTAVCLDASTFDAVPLLAKAGVSLVSSSAAFGVGCGVSTFSGSRALLIEGYFSITNLFSEYLFDLQSLVSWSFAYWEHCNRYVKATDFGSDKSSGIEHADRL